MRIVTPVDYAQVDLNHQYANAECLVQRLLTCSAEVLRSQQPYVPDKLFFVTSRASITPGRRECRQLKGQ
jgi:hypothetical protein